MKGNGSGPYLTLTMFSLTQLIHGPNVFVLLLKMNFAVNLSFLPILDCCVYKMAVHPNYDCHKLGLFVSNVKVLRMNVSILFNNELEYIYSRELSS